MRVTITTEIISREEAGRRWYQHARYVKEYEVQLKVELSEEERAILNAYDLWDVVVVTRPLRFPADVLRATPGLAEDEGFQSPYGIFCFVTGNYTERFPTSVDAANFEAELREIILPKIKQYIHDAHKTAGNRSQTFDL
jgi:hypothetical protein